MLAGTASPAPVLVATAANEPRLNGERRAVVTLCAAAGMGGAALLERVAWPWTIHQRLLRTVHAEQPLRRAASICPAFATVLVVRSRMLSAVSVLLYPS
ncbi:hypothetical protein ACFL59_04755 [Planctomycetota bacterium]